MHFSVDGFKVLDSGRKLRAIGYRIRRSKRGPTIYTATLWEDHSTSCNCPGWANRQVCGHVTEEGPWPDTLHGQATMAPMGTIPMAPMAPTGTRRIKA